MLSAVAAMERLAASRVPLAQITNFLVLAYPRALGTAIHATPIVDALRASVPGARVVVAASGFAAETFRGHPGVEHLALTPNPVNDWRAAGRALRSETLFGGEPFVGLQLQGSERTPISLASMLGGVHRRVGFATQTALTEKAVPVDKSISLVANNLAIITALGHGDALRQAIAQDPEIAEPKLFPSPEHREAAERILREAGVDLRQPFAIFVTQTFVAQKKSWRAERFRAVADFLAGEYGLQIVFAGTSAEAEATDALRAPLSMPHFSVAGKTTIPELAALMGMASVAVTLDTGPMHVARAVRLPMVIIAPAWSPIIEWLPLGNPRARILKNLDLPTMPDDYIIDEVSVDEVCANLRDLLALYPPHAPAL